MPASFTAFLTALGLLVGWPSVNLGGGVEGGAYVPNDYTSIADSCWLQDTGDTTSDNCSGGGTSDTATEVGTVAYTDQDGLRCRDLDGTGDYFTVADSADLNTTANVDFTICAFIDTNGTTGFEGIIAKGTDGGATSYRLRLNNDHDVDASIGTSTENYNLAPDTTMHHYCMRWDDANDAVEIFFDGVVRCTPGVDCTADTDGVSSATTTLYLGNHADAGAADINGRICDVSIFNDAALTSHQICEICSFGTDGADSSRNGSICDSCDYTP